MASPHTAHFLRQSAAAVVPTLHVPADLFPPLPTSAGNSREERKGRSMRVETRGLDVSAI